LLLCLSPLLAHAETSKIGPNMGGTAFTHRAKPRDYDKNQLRAEVDETQSLFDSLARESRRLDKAAHEELLKALPMDYNLSDAVSPARKVLEKAEDLLDIQDGIKLQQAKLKAVLDDSAAADKEEQKLLGMQSDLLTTVEELRKILTSQQKDLNESATRDYRNWIMVSEGLLRRRREDAEAKVPAPALEAPAISAEGIALPSTSTAKP